MKSIRLAAAFAVPAVVLAAGAAADQSFVQDKLDFFPIAVWQQPADSFGKWKGRGVNTLFEVPSGGHDYTTWSDAALANGMFMLRKPNINFGNPDWNADNTAALQSDWGRFNTAAVAQGGLLAWSQRDEPDHNGDLPSEMVSRYNKMKAAVAAAPVIINFSAGDFLDPAKANKARYQEYMSAGDILSSDIYPITGWNRPDWISYTSATADRRNPGVAVDRLNEWGAGAPYIDSAARNAAKAQMAFIEAADANLSWVRGGRGPTAAEMRGQTWDAIIHGARGISYFTLDLDRTFNFDGTYLTDRRGRVTYDTATEMTKQNARIGELARVINDERDPETLSVSLTDATGRTFTSVVADGPDQFYASQGQPIEATWRHVDLGTEGLVDHALDGDYFFVLNMSDAARGATTIRFDGVNGDFLGIVGESMGPDGVTFDAALGFATITDTFNPFEMHVYKFDLGFEQPATAMAMVASFGGASAVPEPGTAGVALGAAALLAARRRRR
jgi:hypothetical protein